LVAGVAATAVERWERVDDNVSIPLVSLAVLIPAFVFKLNLPLP
jgi:hypothetical protein